MLIGAVKYEKLTFTHDGWQREEVTNEVRALQNIVHRTTNRLGQIEMDLSGAVELNKTLTQK